MECIAIKRMKFSTYMKISFQIGLSTGIFFGVMGLALSLFGVDTYANIGTTYFVGIKAGIIMFVLAPILLVVMSTIFGLFTFIPYMLHCFIFRKTNLYFVPINSVEVDFPGRSGDEASDVQNNE